MKLYGNILADISCFKSWKPHLISWKMPVLIQNKNWPVRGFITLILYCEHMSIQILEGWLFLKEFRLLSVYLKRETERKRENMYSSLWIENRSFKLIYRTAKELKSDLNTMLKHWIWIEELKVVQTLI